MSTPQKGASVGMTHKRARAAQEQQTDNLDEVIGVAENGGLLLDAETATVVFVRWEKKTMWGQDKIIFWFSICDPVEHMGKELFMACVAPKTRKFPARAKFTRCWTLANGQPPDRFDRMTMRVFQAKAFVVKLKTVTENKNGILPPHEHYTVIETLLSQG